MAPHPSMAALLKDIEIFLKKHPIKETTFGAYALKDGRFVERLRNGGRVWPETEEKVRGFMRDYKGPERPPGRPRKDKAPAKTKRGRK